MPSADRRLRPRAADLSLILEGLIEAGVDFILVEGLAAVAQGVPVTTIDVDIVHRRSDNNIDRLLEFLRSVDAIHRRPDDKIIEPQREHLAARGHCLFTTRFGPLDVLAIIEHGLGYEELLQHSVEIEFRGHGVRVLDLAMLVDLKRASKDPKDIKRLLIIEETLRQLREKDE